MSKWRLFVPLFVFTLTPAGSLYAEMYKCPSSNGAMSFTDKPCQNGYKNTGDSWVSVEEQTKAEKERAHKEIIEKEEQTRKSQEQARQDEGQIKESDLFLYGDMKKYKRDVTLMLNKLAAEYPNCKNRIDPATAGISKDKSTPDNPAFFVHCGDRKVPEVVRFTLEDIKSQNIPKAATVMNQSTAHNICRNEAKRRSLVPNSVSFSDFLNPTFNKYPNGNSIFSSTFTAENALGKKSKFRIFCFFDGKPSLTDVSVKPAE